MKKILINFIISCLFAINGHTQTADFDVFEVCEGDITIFINTSISSVPIDTVLWDLDGNGLFNDDSGDTVKKAFLAGTYNIGMRIITDIGTSAAVYKQVTIYNLPIADFYFGDTCFNSPTWFRDTSIVNAPDSISNLFWSFGDGSITDKTSNPQHTYANTGPYDVELVVVTINGCLDTIIKSLFIHPIPSINFIFDGPTTFLEGGDVTVSIQETGYSLTWSTGETTDSITIDKTGMFTLDVVDINSCTNSESFSVLVNEISMLEIMNLLTPNSDGYNDYWKIKNLELCSDGKIKIFNRWGNEVFSATKYNNDWNGQYKGKKLPEGTYYYVIYCNDSNVFQGAVNILR